MKVVLSPQQQRWLALALAGIVALLVAALIVLPLWREMSFNSEQISVLRAQAAKLEALTAARPRLEAATRDALADKNLQSLTFASALPSEGAAELQSTLNQIFSAAGATVTSGQALEGAGDVPGKIAVRTVVLTDIASLVRALVAIGTSRPLLSIEKMSITEPDGEFTAVGPQPAVANKLSVEIVVSARLRGA